MSQNKESDASKIFKERLIWVFKPFLLVSILMFWLHPNNTQLDTVERSILIGFLLGAVYALFLYRKDFLVFLTSKSDLEQRAKNRMPQEYYIGKIKSVLHGQEGDKE